LKDLACSEGVSATLEQVWGLVQHLHTPITLQYSFHLLHVVCTRALHA